MGFVFKKQKYFFPILLFGAITFSNSLSVQAQDTATNNGLELSLSDILELRVTSLASGTALPIHLAPAVTTVITQADIKAMGARTFEEVIDTIPGVHTTMGPVGASRYYIRGVATTYNPETLVMVNGFPITSSVRGERNGRMGVLPVSVISRIEVIRGPGSALYGAEAFAGVINVITKNADDLTETTIGGRSGSFNTQEGWVQTGATYDDFKIAVLANYMTTDGHKREITLDALKTSPLAITPGPMNLEMESSDLLFDVEKKNWRLQVGQRNVNHVGLGQGLADNLDPNAHGNRSRTTIDLTFHNPKLTQNLDFTAKVGYYHGTQEFPSDILLFPAGMNLGSGVFPDGVRGKPEYKERNWYYDTIAAYKGFDQHILRFGVGGAIADLYEVRESKNFTPTFAPRGSTVDVTDTPEVWLPEKRRDNSHIFAQDEWNFAKDWELTLGARFDHFSDFGDTLNPRSALVWQTNSELTTKLMYGSAFRSPNFVELYTQNNPIALGNTSLKPQTNQVYELAFAYYPSRSVNFGLNLYHYEIRNNISFVRNGATSTATAQNVGDVNGDGLEFETQYKMSANLTLVGNYSYVQTKSKPTEKSVGDYPTHQAYLRQEWAYSPSWDLNGQVRWVGPRPRTPTDVRDDVAGYTKIDIISRSKKLFYDCDVALSVRNILDSDIREPSAPPSAVSNTTTVTIPYDLPQEGRSLFAELTYSF